MTYMKLKSKQQLRSAEEYYFKALFKKFKGRELVWSDDLFDNLEKIQYEIKGVSYPYYYMQQGGKIMIDKGSIDRHLQKNETCKIVTVFKDKRVFIVDLLTVKDHIQGIRYTDLNRESYIIPIGVFEEFA